MVDPEAGAAFLGSQGDIWDAQKDMLLAIVGSLGTLLIVMFVHMAFNRDFYHEFKDSFKLSKDDRPLGEVKLEEMMKN
jgi:putative membrane protein